MDTIWRTFARWRDRGVWQEAMDVLRRRVRRQRGRMPEPSMLMVDCQVIKGGRAGPSFHHNHGKYHLNGAKRVIAVDYLGLPVGACVVGARRHEVAATRSVVRGNGSVGHSLDAGRVCRVAAHVHLSGLVATPRLQCHTRGALW